MPIARQVSFTLPEQSSQTQLDRLQKLSIALMGQGGLNQPEAQTVPGYPGPWVVQPAWTEYAGKLANQAATLYKERKAEDKQKQTIATEQAKMAEALRAYKETGDPNALMGATQTQPAALDLIIQDARRKRLLEAMQGQQGPTGTPQGNIPMPQPGGPAGGAPMAAWLEADPSGKAYFEQLGRDTLEVRKAEMGATYAPPARIPTESGQEVSIFPPEFPALRRGEIPDRYRQPEAPEAPPQTAPQGPVPLPPAAAPRQVPSPAQPAPGAPMMPQVPPPVAPGGPPPVRPAQGLGPPGQMPRTWQGQITMPTPAGPVPAQTGAPQPPAAAAPTSPQPLPMAPPPGPVPGIPAAAAPLPSAAPMGAPQAPFAQQPGMPGRLPPSLPPGAVPLNGPAGHAPIVQPFNPAPLPQGVPLPFSPQRPGVAPPQGPTAPQPFGMPGAPGQPELRAPTRPPVQMGAPQQLPPAQPPGPIPGIPGGMPGQPVPMPGGAPQRPPVMAPQPQRIPLMGAPRRAEGMITRPTPGGPIPAQTGPRLPIEMPGMIPGGPQIPPTPAATRPDIMPNVPRGTPVQGQPRGRTGQPINPIPIKPQPVARLNPRIGRYAETIAKAAKDHGVDPNILSWMAQKESAGDHKAIGHADSKVTGYPSSGLMQLQPGTAKRFGVTNPLDPKQAIPGAAKYVSVLLKRYGGDYDKALAAYNWGEGNLDKALQRAEKSGKDWQQHIPASTRDYVRYIRSNAVGGGNVAPQDQRSEGPGLLERAMDFLVPSAQAQDLGRIGVTPPPSQATQVERGKAGGKALDEAFAKEYATSLNAIGDVPRQLANMRQVIANLSDPSKNLSGPVLGMMPDALLKFTNPEAVNTRQLLEEVVQRGLRPILGAQFTENEGERLIKRMYDPGLPEKDNLMRVQRLAAQMEIAYANKVDAMRYFDQKGTLMGWQGKLPTIADFEAIGSGSKGGQSDIFQQADEILNRGQR